MQKLHKNHGNVKIYVLLKAVDVKDDINTFLKQFNINITDDDLYKIKEGN